MRGKIGYAAHVSRYYVAWYHAPHKKTYKIYKYKGEPLYDERMAEKLLACIQADVEKGVFRIEQYTKETPCDVIPYLKQWVEIVRPTLSPATYKDYLNSINNHIIPFFERNPQQLHEIQHDTLLKLLNGIERDGKGKMNVMYCFHACLDFAWRSNRVPMVPPFPRKRAYQIVEKQICWLPESRQRAIIEAIPEEHQPIFWWLKFHLRRPCEAMALQVEDFDGDSFIIRRSFSNKVLTERTKTGQIHNTPMVDEFRPYLDQMRKRTSHIFSRFFFVNSSSKMAGKYYTHRMLGDLWKKACKKVGESISLYAGLKHSSCSQLINEYGFSTSQVQMATDHARLDSVKKYAKVELSAKKAILEKRIIRLPQPGTDLELKREEKIQ